MTRAQVLAKWGRDHGVCRGCKRRTWYFTYHHFQPQGAAVEFTRGRVSALWTLWSADRLADDRRPPRRRPRDRDHATNTARSSARTASATTSSRCRRAARSRGSWSWTGRSGASSSRRGRRLPAARAEPRGCRPAFGPRAPRARAARRAGSRPGSGSRRAARGRRSRPSRSEYGRARSIAAPASGAPSSSPRPFVVVASPEIAPRCCRGISLNRSPQASVMTVPPATTTGKIAA